MEYEELKNFFAIFVEHFMKSERLAEEKRPIAVLAALEKKSPSKAKKGLQMAVNDCLEMSSDWDKELVSAFDEYLKVHNVVTLTELRIRHSKKFMRIMERGIIRTEVEYYLCKEIADSASLELTTSESHALDIMLDAYGQRALSMMKHNSQNQS